MPPVPPIPAHLSTPAKSSETLKTSSSKLQLDIPGTTNNSGDAAVTAKPHPKELAAAEVEVKVNAAIAIMKTPSSVDRARQDEYYEIEVRGFSQMKFGS
jgi:hypothetical protein